MAVPPAPVRITSQWSLLSPNDEGGNGVKPGSVLRSRGIYCMTDDENLGKPQLGYRLMEAVRPVMSQMGSLTSK